jgi:transposase/ribosomal protein L31E
MDRTKVLQEIRKMRFEEIYKQRTEKRLTTEEAAQILGVTDRTVRRWCARYKEKGLGGLEDRRIGKKANNAAPIDEEMELLELFKSRYSDFRVAHFYDKWIKDHGGTRCYTWVKNRLQESGLVTKAKKRGAHRKKRPRRPMIGMMLHQDGSSHEWIEGEIWDLVVTLDDATSEIYSAFFVEEEGTWSSFRGIKEVIEKYGLFCSLYTDRGSHYWHTSKGKNKPDEEIVTQFQRAMQQLGIEMIAAFSPEARGRSERAFRTLQERLSKELKLEGITTMDAANEYLKKKFIAEYNKKFSVKAQEEESAFVPWLNHNFNLDDVLCIQEQRIVGKDNTVSYKNKKLQIPKDKTRCNYIKARIRIHEYANGSLTIFHGPRRLASYNAHGMCLENINLMAS